MHEVGLSRALVAELVATCSRIGIVRLRSAVVDVGALTTYKPEPLRHYFAFLTQDVPLLRDASIDVRIVPATLVCATCNEQQVFAPTIEACTRCRSSSLRLEGGSRVTLKEITGETHV